MMKTFIILCFAILTFTAVAQVSPGGNVSISTTSPKDSVIHFDAQLDQSTQWVWIEVKKGDKKENIFVETKKQQFPIKSYLKFGPGIYTIQIYLTANPTQYSNAYRFGARYEVNNLDSRTDVELIAPSSVIQSEDPEIVALATELTFDLETDMQKTKAIYEWITNNIAYDVEGYFTGSYAGKKHDALTILKNREAVCEGYSNLTAALNRAAGIPMKKVTGEARFKDAPWTGKMNHAWNEALVDGKWVIQDSTWDAGQVDFQTRTFHANPRLKYFNPTPAEFAKDHREMP